MDLEKVTYDNHPRIDTARIGNGPEDVYTSLPKTEPKNGSNTTNKSFFKRRPLLLSVALISAALIGTLVRWPDDSRNSQVQNPQNPQVQDAQTLTSRELEQGLPVSEEGTWVAFDCPANGEGFENCMSCRKEQSSGQVECTACYGSHQLLNKNCVRRCGFNERNSPNDTDKCELCPSYHVGDRSNVTQCKPIVCNSTNREVIAKIGMGDIGNGCNSCPPQMVTDSTQKICIHPVCGDNFESNAEQNRFRIEQDGTCKQCPEWFESTKDRMGCVPIQCPVTHKVVAHGCEVCLGGSFQNPTDTKSCYFPKCNPIEQMYFDYKEGQCKKCKPFEFPDAATGYQSCKRTVCPFYQKLNKNGQCIDCPLGQKKYFRNPLQCERIYCKYHEIVDPRTLQCRKCQDYQLPTNNYLDCHYGKCDSRQIVEKAGTCINCMAYHTPSPDKLRCVKPLCGKHEKATVNGGCEPYECPSGKGFKREADGQWGCTKCAVDHCHKCDKDYQTCDEYSLEGQIVNLLGHYHIGDELTALLTWPDALQLELNYSPRPMQTYSGLPLKCPVPDARMHYDIQNLHGFGATGKEEQVHFSSLAFLPKEGFGETADGQDIKFRVYFSDSWDPQGKDWDLPYLPYTYDFYVLQATSERQAIGWEYNSVLNKYLKVVRASQYEIREGHVQELSFNYKK